MTVTTGIRVTPWENLAEILTPAEVDELKIRFQEF
jgi:hypothetical protein